MPGSSSSSMLAGEHTAAIGPQLEGKHEENDTGLPTCPICAALSLVVCSNSRRGPTLEKNDKQVFACAGLADILNLQDKAVVSSCMHAFCLHCLLRWLDYKRSCPLCKVWPARSSLLSPLSVATFNTSQAGVKCLRGMQGRVSSYFYRITEQGEYNERVVPLTPPREQPPEPRGVPRIDEARSQVAPSASLR